MRRHKDRQRPSDMLPVLRTPALPAPQRPKLLARARQAGSGLVRRPGPPLLKKSSWDGDIIPFQGMSDRESAKLWGISVAELRAWRARNFAESEAWMAARRAARADEDNGTADDEEGPFSAELEGSDEDLPALGPPTWGS